MNIVITGANRGIGLELVRQYLARGDSVHAGVRTPSSSDALAALGADSGGRLRVQACDVTDEAGVRAFAESVDAPVDVLINNAGARFRPDELSELGQDHVVRTFEVNAVGPMRVATAMLPMLRRTRGSKIINLGSGLGSIEGNTSGGVYGYRMSKAALNMASRSLAEDLREEGIIVAVLSPGWVRTDMGGPDAPLAVEASVAGLLGVIDRLTLRDSGGFFGVQGERIPW